MQMAHNANADAMHVQHAHEGSARCSPNFLYRVGGSAQLAKIVVQAFETWSCGDVLQNFCLHKTCCR